MRHTCEEDFRRAFVELAMATVGLHAGPTGRDAYLELVGPDEREDMRAAMTTARVNGRPGMSGCALVIRGLMRRAGISHVRLDAPYVVGRAVQDIGQIGREARAWTMGGKLAVSTPAELAELVKPANVFLIDGPEHVGTISGVIAVPDERGGGLVVDSIDGGQRTADGWQTIASRTRRWEHDGGWLVVFSSRGVAQADVGQGNADRRTVERRILGVVDLWKVYQRFAVGGPA